MDLENHNEVLENGEKYFDVEGELNLEEELINALSELRKMQEKYAWVKEQLGNLKRRNCNSNGISKETEQIIATQKL